MQTQLDTLFHTLIFNKGKMLQEAPVAAVKTPDADAQERFQRKIDAQSDSSPSDDASVYLETKWTTVTLRHPALRLLNCVLHLVVTFFLCASSPLNGSLHAPAYFPVYGHWIAVWCTQVTWQKAVFHGVLAVLVVALLRIVLYRKFVQPQWNWQTEFRRAKRAFSRMSSVAAVPVAGTTGEQQQDDTGGSDVHSNRVIMLHTQTSTLGAQSTMRVQILSVDGAESQGSWTFIASCFPFMWSCVVFVVHKVVGDTEYEQILFGKGSSATTVTQMRAQVVLYQVLMVLSTLKLLVTLDLVLQDVHYARRLYGNWLVAVRRAYVTHPVLRMLACWVAIATVAVVGVFFRGFESLQSAWVALNLNDEYADMLQQWYSNESWNTLLGGVVVSLDILWLTQDYGFPGVPTPVGVNIFGFWKETVSFKMIGRASVTSFSSAWLSYFVVLAVLLPLEMCHFFQLFTYAPEKYDQYVDDATHRVFPLLVSRNANSAELHMGVQATQMKLLQFGSVSRYFEWSVWERAPALALILLALLFTVWLWREERFKMRFSAFLGVSQLQRDNPHHNGAHADLSTIHAHLSKQTKQTLAKQTRLRELYALRSRIDNFCITLAAVSVIAVVLQFRSIWRSQSLVDAQQDADGNHSTDSDIFLPLQFPGEAYGVLLFAVTCALLWQLYQRYVVKMQLMVLRNEIPRECGAALWRSPKLLLGPFLVELLMCGFCLPPFVHADINLQETRYSLPRLSTSVLTTCPSRMAMTDATNQACDLKYRYPLEIVNMAVLVRLYWFVRIIRNQLLRKVVAEHIMIVSGVFQDVPMDSLRWSFKVAFRLAPGKLLLSLFLFFWAGTASAVSIFERPFPSLLDNEEHSLWLTIVTMSSVGYGDAYPMTAYGRVSIFLGAVVGGSFLVSLMTSVFLDAVKGSKAEHKVVATMERVTWHKQMWTTGAVLVSSAWKRYQLRKKNAENERSAMKASRRADRRLFSIAHQFKILRKQKPKETYDSMEALKMNAMAHWRAHELSAWMTEIHDDTHTHLDMLEQQLGSIEQSLQRLLVH